MDDALSSYLLDHLANVGDAAAAIEAERARTADPRLDEFLDRTAEQLREDEAILKGILHQRGHRDGTAKGAAGRLWDKLRAVKLSDGTPLERMQALESLALGIHGRVLLWRALEEVASRYRELQAIDFGWLKARANECHEAVDRFRLEAACAVFAESLERSDARDVSPEGTA